MHHYVNLSQLNYGRRHRLLSARLVHHEVQPQEKRVGAAPLPGFAGLPPDGPGRGRAGGFLSELEAMLAEISGMAAVTLQPAAHGGLTGPVSDRPPTRGRGGAEY